jgi:hypothetical protein
MNEIEIAREGLVARFRAELEFFRERMGDSVWQSLDAALQPTFQSLRAETEEDSEAAAWAAVAQRLDESTASDVSEAVKRFSQALKEHYRSITPRDSRVSEAIAFLYIDVARPLWTAHPTLEPIELRDS